MQLIAFHAPATVLMLGAATAAVGQTPGGSGEFVMRVGTSEIGSESFTRHADTLRGTIRIPNQPRLDYVAVIRPDFTLASLALSVFAADASPSAAPLRQMQFELSRDSVFGVVNGTAQRFAVAAGAVPLINGSWATIELLTRRARAAGGTFSAPVWALSNAAPFTVVLTPIASDSMSMVVAGQRTDLRVDAGGQILGGTIAAQGISMTRVDSNKAAAFATATTPLPAGLRERDVSIKGPVPLPGTLTLPVGSGPFPIVVLVHGSSASDRDETIGPNKPFRDLAWGLAERGIAVLRYDKRTYVRPAWFAGRNSTVDDETVQDALSALTIARALPEADSTRSFLLGHSLGAIMAPRIAKADGKVAGVIIMAGATRMPLIDQMSRQLAYLDSIGGADSAASRAQRDAFAPSAARVRALTPADSTDNAPIPGMGGTGTRYWLDLNRYDPALVMRQLRIGALVLTGLRDYQVPSDQADAWLTAAGSRSDITVKRYPGLNHLFMTGTGRPSPADYAVPGHVDSQVITDIAAWIRRQPAH